jgi:hypothetical protein
MQKKNKVTVDDVKKIVYESVKKIMKEDREYMEGNPQSVLDVLKSDGWNGRMVENSPNRKVVRVFTTSNEPFTVRGDSLDFEELVDDIRVYYSHKGLKVNVEGVEEYNGKQGAFIIFNK